MQLPAQPSKWYPLLFRPIYRVTLWGGGRIRRLYRRPHAPSRFCGESWELADRAEASSVIRNGYWRGHTLNHVLQLAPHEVGGTRVDAKERFPLLIKIIDARERLSVQVHPTRAAARRLGGDPKTEMWYILDAPAGARIFAGFRPGVDRRTVERALQERCLVQYLRSVPVVPGECLYVPAGRVHAIGEGCLVLEIQQNSDTTYRLYDWGRLDRSGTPRPLHIREALTSIRWIDTRPLRVRRRELRGRKEGVTQWPLLRTPYFEAYRFDIRNGQTFENDGRSCHILFVERGAVRVSCSGGRVDLTPGTTCLMPAAIADYRAMPRDGLVRLIRVTLRP